MEIYGMVYLLTFIKLNTPDYYYIGKTTQPIKKRINDHLYRAWELNKDGNFKNTFRVVREFRKYGIKDKKNDIIWDENHLNIKIAKNYLKVKIIDSAESEEELINKEKKYILEYHSYEYFPDSRGFNGTLGGDGNSSGVFSGENSPIAQLTNYQAKQVRLLNRDTSLTYGELANLFECSLGCIHHIVWDNTYKDALINESDVIDEEFAHWINYAPLSRRKSKYFYSYDLRESVIENRVQMWTSNVKCATELGEGVTGQKISYALGGNRGIVANHFAFVYDENKYDFEEKQLPRLQKQHNKRFRSFSAYDVKTGKYIDTFNCMGTCLKELQLKKNSPVYRCLKDIFTHSGEFIFIYDDRFTLDLLKEKIELANPRLFYMFNFEGTQIGDTWTILKKCADMFRIDATSISRCLKFHKPYKDKYIFLYVDEYNKELLNSIIGNINNKERYLLFNLEGESLGISNSQFDLYHNKKIHTVSYALKTKKYYIPSKDLIIIPESQYNLQLLMTIINKVKLEKNKYTESRTNSNKKILIYSKDKLVGELPNARAALQSGIIPLHAAYRVPRRKNKIYKNELIIIYEKDATPSVLMALRKKLEGGKP